MAINNSVDSEPRRSFDCFVCSSSVRGKNFTGIKRNMTHSHAPALALLTDVLGYKFEVARLHSEVNFSFIGERHNYSMDRIGTRTPTPVGLQDKISYRAI